MNIAIVVAGVLGLAVAAYAVVDLIVSAGRRRHVLDIVVVPRRKGRWGFAR